MPGVPPEDPAIIERILAIRGLEGATVQFLARGATSRVWRAQTPDGPVVVRLGDPAEGKHARFDADFGVRQRLHQVDGRVAEPLMAGRGGPSMPGDRTAIPWCVDRFIAGETAPRGAIPERVCRDLGELLSRLHALPVSCHGLLEDRRDALVGQCSDPVAGLMTRLQDPWPFTPFPLEDHPIAAAAPDLIGVLAPLEARLKQVVIGQRCSLCHTDLHERQLLIADGRLVGLLDFGDATIGPPAWDIASFGYFHGWRLAQEVLTGYTSDQRGRDRLLADARLFAILIALHHASRSVTLRQPRRISDAIRFLRLTGV